MQIVIPQHLVARYWTTILWLREPRNRDASWRMWVYALCKKYVDDSPLLIVQPPELEAMARQVGQKNQEAGIEAFLASFAGKAGDEALSYARDGELPTDMTLDPKLGLYATERQKATQYADLWDLSPARQEPPAPKHETTEEELQKALDSFEAAIVEGTPEEEAAIHARRMAAWDPET